MIAEPTSDVLLDGSPDVYVWMTASEAAQTLDTQIETIQLRAREGDLESRLDDRGEIEVLVSLASQRRPAIERPLVRSIQEGRLPGGPVLMPMSGRSLFSRDAEQGERRPSNRLAWGVAAAMALAAGAASLIASSLAIGSREKSTALARRLEMVTLAVNDLSGQRDRLRTQLSATNDELTKVQGELAVDRNVEDTLFGAIQAAHKNTEPKSPQFADIGH